MDLIGEAQVKCQHPIRKEDGGQITDCIICLPNPYIKPNTSCLLQQHIGIEHP